MHFVNINKILYMQNTDWQQLTENLKLYENFLYWRG